MCALFSPHRQSLGGRAESGISSKESGVCRDHSEEIHAGNQLAVVLQKSPPQSSSPVAAMQLRKVTGDSSLGNLQSELYGGTAKLTEIDPNVSSAKQIRRNTAPVVLLSTFLVKREYVEDFLRGFQSSSRSCENNLDLSLRSTLRLRCDKRPVVRRKTSKAAPAANQISNVEWTPPFTRRRSTVRVRARPPPFLNPQLEILRPNRFRFSSQTYQNRSKTRAQSKKPEPYHGYFFHILKSQGADAEGGAMD